MIMCFNFAMVGRPTLATEVLGEILSAYMENSSGM